MSEAPSSTPPTPPASAGSGTGAPSGTAPAGAAGAAGAEAQGPDKIVASKGDYFCQFAAQKGFRNCEKWRQVNPPPLGEKPTLEQGDEIIVPEKTEGETADQDKAEVESVRVDYPPALIRFLGQNTPMGDRTQAGLSNLAVSNYITDKAGLNDHGHSHGFFSDYGADDEAGRNADAEEVTTWNDPDHFRIEVHDVTAGKKNLAEVNVELQVLQPLYKRVEQAGKTVVLRDEDGRPDPNAPKGFRIPGNPDRQLLVICKRIGTTNYYRSKYLRLVTEAKDKIAGQTLFVGDYYQDPLVGATAPASPLSSAAGGGGGGGGPSAGAIAGGAVAGAAIGGAAAGIAVAAAGDKLSKEAKVGIVVGSAVAGAVAGGAIGAAASSGGDEPAAAGAAGATPATATAMTAEETEDTRRYGEILHQRFRARYIPAMCTDLKCRAESFAGIELKNEMRLAVHVFDNHCTNEDVRRCLYGQCRRVYAQTGIMPHLKAIYHHPPPEHIILIGSSAGTGRNATGFVSAPPPPAAGGGPAPAPPAKSRVRVKLDGGHEESFQLNANETVSHLVGRIKSWIEGRTSAAPDSNRLFWTRVVKRPFIGALPANTEESQYILVFTDAKLTQHGKVVVTESNDFNGMSASNPTVSSAQLNSVPKSEDDNIQTILRASCHTGHLDCIVLGAFTSAGLHGLAIRHPKRHKFAPAVLVTSARMTESPHDSRYTLAHEIGHVLMNANHCEHDDHKEQLMILGAKAAGKAEDLEGRRRIMDRPMQVTYKTYTNDVTVGTAEELLGSTAALKTATERCHMFLPGVLDSFGGETPREPQVEW